MVLFDFPGAWCLYISRMHTISCHFMVFIDLSNAYHFMVFIDFLKEYHFSERQFAISHRHSHSTSRRHNLWERAPVRDKGANAALDNAALHQGYLPQ